ncbi:MAG: YdcF family protein [Gammaproteobacteria bacterium]|nr:YdcF family protein [Gammaproteobacteria bacterium]
MKAVADVLATPLVLVLLMALIAAMCRVRGRTQASKILLAAAALGAYAASIPLVGHALLRPLESQYPPLHSEQLPSVGYIVVLGSGYAPHDGIPVTAALDREGVIRAVEALRLLRLLPEARLVVSGGAVDGQHPVAQGYAQLTRALGVPEKTLIVADQPHDTRAESLELGKMLGGTPFLLVTSAFHMPRAMLLMRRAGARPIAAPTGQRAFGPMPFEWRSLLPGAGGLGDTERALHEYAGLVAINAGLD